MKLAESKGVPLDKLSLEEMQTLHPLFAADVSLLWSYENRCSNMFVSAVLILRLYKPCAIEILESDFLCCRS